MVQKSVDWTAVFCFFFLHRQNFHIVKKFKDLESPTVKRRTLTTLFPPHPHCTLSKYE